MVTMQSWMFLRSFAELRALPEDKLPEARKRGTFTGLLRETSIELLAHLGPNAFEEISGEVVQSVMMTLANRQSNSEHRMAAFRLVGIRSAVQKAEELRRNKYGSHSRYTPMQKIFISIIDSPISYWLDNVLLIKFAESKSMSSEFLIKGGLSTTDNERFRSVPLGNILS